MHVLKEDYRIAGEDATSILRTSIRFMTRRIVLLYSQRFYLKNGQSIITIHALNAKIKINNVELLILNRIITLSTERRVPKLSHTLDFNASFLTFIRLSLPNFSWISA